MLTAAISQVGACRLTSGGYLPPHKCWVPAVSQVVGTHHLTSAGYPPSHKCWVPAVSGSDHGSKANYAKQASSNKCAISVSSILTSRPGTALQYIKSLPWSKAPANTNTSTAVTECRVPVYLINICILIYVTLRCSILSPPDLR